MSITIITNNLGIEEKHLRMASGNDVNGVLKECAQRRMLSRLGSNGWRKDKNMRAVGSIPASIFYHPKFRHIFNDSDMKGKDRQKVLERFYRKFPKFQNVDRL